MNRMGVLLVMGLASVGCDQGPSVIFQDGDTDVDVLGPELSHEYDPSPRTFGEAIFLGANVLDASDIKDVKIVFQRETDGSSWTELRMAPYSDSYYEGSIPGKEVESGGIRYYIFASDQYDNTSCLPEACEAEAWHFPVVPPR